MTTTEDTNSTADVIGEIGKVVVKETALAVVEVAGAVVLLAAIGFVAQKFQERKAKKTLANSEA